MKPRPIWIACLVRGGPFPDERRVYLKTDFGDEWFGFVQVRNLKAHGEGDTDHVAGRIVEDAEGYVVAQVYGSSPASGAIRIGAPTG